MLTRLRSSSSAFWVGLVAWFAILSIADLLTAGQMRPVLVLVLLAGAVALYLAARPAA